MASPIRSFLHVENTEVFETWIRGFVTLVKTKKLEDNKINGREYKTTDLFLAIAGYEAVRKNVFMTFNTGGKIDI